MNNIPENFVNDSIGYYKCISNDVILEISPMLSDCTKAFSKCHSNCSILHVKNGVTKLVSKKIAPSGGTIGAIGRLV